MRTHTIGGQAHELAAQGREFDRLMQKHYSARGAFNEVPIRARTGKYRRLDTYDPVEKEIISRKSFAASNGQLAFADKDDVIGYLQEFALKYRNGAVVPKVPSAGSLAGKTIVGRYVLEIPPQNYPVPPFVLEQAKIRGIIIRDALGRTL